MMKADRITRWFLIAGFIGFGIAATYASRDEIAKELEQREYENYMNRITDTSEGRVYYHSFEESRIPVSIPD